MVQLRLFGGASLESGEKPITGRSAQRRRIALLALLALARRGLTRDKLIGYLWAESDMEKARRLLSESLYVLRREMGEDAITAAGDELRLNPAVIECDVVAFEDAIERDDLEKAARLYAGPFLDGFHVSDALELERWIDFERDRLARAYGRALERLAEAAGTEGRRDDAVGWWRRMVELDPFSGRFAVGLMQALEAAGNRAAALQHASIHRTLLREELDAEPDPAVAGLAERLRESPDPTWTPPPAQTSPPAASSGPAASAQVEPSGDTEAAKRPAHGTIPAVPVGSTVTFLFSDIEGSTALLRRLGPKYGDLLATHHAIIRDCLLRSNGREIDTAGDGFFIAFPRARDAVTAAVAIRRRLAETEWPDGVTVRLRMGLHTGEPAPTSTGFVGLDVHRAARIAGLARGGQILLSGVTRELIAGDVPAGAVLRDYGTHTLKDIDEPEHLWEIEPDAISVSMPGAYPVSSPGPGLIAGAVASGSHRPRSPADATDASGRVETPSLVTPRGVPYVRNVRPRNLFIAVALVVVAVVGFALSGSRGGVPDPGTTAAADPTIRVVILPFQCRSCRAELDDLREWLRLTLDLRLNGVGEIRVTPAQQVNLLPRRLLDAPSAGRIAERFSATHVVQGHLAESGGVLTVAAELIGGSPRGDTVKVGAEGSLERVDSLVDVLALDLIEALIEGPGRERAVAGVRALATAEARRAWVRGEREFAAARYPQAVEAFEEVVRADPTFVHGYHRLSMAREWNLQFAPAHEAADAAMRHLEQLPPAQRSLIRAWHALLNGRVETAQRLYEAILRDQDDQVEAWYGLGEIHAHFATPRGQPVGPAKEYFGRVLELVTPVDMAPGAMRPGYGDAVYHLLEYAAAEGDRVEYETLLAAVDTGSYQRLGFEAVRAFGWGDQSDQAAIERRLGAQLEHLKIGTAAARIAAHVHDFDGASRIARIIVDKPGTSADWRAGARLLMAEFSFAAGRFEEAFAEVYEAAPLEAQWPREIRGLFALPRFVELPPEQLVRIRDDIEAWDTGDNEPSDEFFFGVHGWVHRYIRLYLLGMLDVRLGHLQRAEQSRAELARPVSATPNSAPLKNALEASLGAHIELARGNVERALIRLENVKIEAWIEQVGFSPFYSRAYDRLVIAELRRERGEPEEALRWYRSLTEGYEVLFVAPAHYRMAGIFDQLGQPDSAKVHRETFKRLWAGADTTGLAAPRW